VENSYLPLEYRPQMFRLDLFGRTIFPMLENLFGIRSAAPDNQPGRGYSPRGNTSIFSTSKAGEAIPARRAPDPATVPAALLLEYLCYRGRLIQYQFRVIGNRSTR